jgi:hypothetical protein
MRLDTFYQAQPAPFRDSDLSAYLTAVSLLNAGDPESAYQTLAALHFDDSPEKEAARVYLLARVALAATASTNSPNCGMWAQRARDGFQQVVDTHLPPARSFFKQPAARKLRDVQEKPPC